MKKILPIIFFSLLISSCSKVDQPVVQDQPTFVYLSSSFKPFMFKNGDYWVYKNDSTNAIDSVAVTSISEDFLCQPVAKVGCEYIQYYKINMHDYLKSTDYYDFLSYTFIRRNGDSPYPWDGQPLLNFGESKGQEQMGAGLIDSIPSLTVGTNTFHKVVKMKITAAKQNLHVFDYDTYLYFKDSVGIIKMETDTGTGVIESWSLLRWKSNL